MTQLLGERIAEVREQLGISQATVATRMGVNRSHIHRIENSSFTNPRIGTLSRIATALGVPVCELLIGTEHEVSMTERSRKLLRDV